MYTMYMFIYATWQFWMQVNISPFQLSIKYDADLADLTVALNQVKGQSLGDVFINTYLIPDVR